VAGEYPDGSGSGEAGKYGNEGDDGQGHGQGSYAIPEGWTYIQLSRRKLGVRGSSAHNCAKL
jgi:hypothetical protein